MTRDEAAMRISILNDLHLVIKEEFNAQLKWWSRIPLVGIPSLMRRDQLIWLGQCIVDLTKETRREMEIMP